MQCKLSKKTKLDVDKILGGKRWLRSKGYLAIGYNILIFLFCYITCEGKSKKKAFTTGANSHALLMNSENLFLKK